MLIPLLFAFFAGFALVLGFWPLKLDYRPKLKLSAEDPLSGLKPSAVADSEKNKPSYVLFLIMSKVAVFNSPIAAMPIGRRMYRDLSLAKSRLSVEEFLLVKEILIAAFVFLVFKFYSNTDLFMFWALMGIAAGYMLPEIWLKTKIKKIKAEVLKYLPDTVDLLGLCVNAGLDFMMALKYVVEKSTRTVVTDELKNMMQEINVGKPRRDALRDLAKKYELPDLSTFSRNLIQADRMGTSVIEALNILSEDMREARFRRGEAMALKAPLKMLVPLLFFIFPVVAILVAGPVFLDFFQNNPLKSLGH
jgi:pilus assembly protein TadC